MRVLAQRVKRADVIVDGRQVAVISDGLLLLVGITREDEQQDADWLVRKVAALRVFNDPAGVMNLSISDVGGEVLAVSQFTLCASTKKGNRPSYIRAAMPEQAKPLFDYFVTTLSDTLGKPVPTGVFGADMQVSLVNDGPVTIWLDSRNQE